MDEKQIFQPDAKFFESDPKASLIRAVCAEIITTLRQLIYPHDEKVDKVEAYARLVQLEAQLIDHGIYPNIHTGLAMGFYAESPLRSAEYLAGQLINILSEDIISEEDIVSMSQEHDFLDADTPGQPYLVDLSNMPENLRLFNIFIATINIVHHLFSLDQEAQ